MSAKASFGQWLKRRRRALDMTQDELAQRVGCAVVTIFKIEAGQRRPSKQIAELLAQHLAIPPADHQAFVKFARSDPTGQTSDTLWGTSIHPPNNLLTPPTPLIGRELDIAAVGKRLLLDDTQLLTLVGPPGTGKTRLSLAVAHDTLNVFSDGAFLVLLAPISDPELVPKAIVQTLGIQETGPQHPLERLKGFLRDRQMLLVLDNFEQILPAAPQIAELLAACPLLKILITSRAPLRVRRERQFPVPALALPDIKQLPEAETLPNYSAVELFIERAQAVKPDFVLTLENSPSVAAICHRLDGLPLAIELISARVKLLPPAALLERLHGRLMLASDGLRDLEPRHRTLNAAIGWSHELLDTAEKTLFRRLSVFVGSWTMDAAEAVCQPEINMLDSMALLVDKSLVQQKTDVFGELRFSMLETIHEYALERLEESGEGQTIRHRHAGFFLKVAEWPATVGQRLWLNRITSNYDNLRAALEWCLPNEVEMGLRLVVATMSYWVVRGHLIEGRSWAEKYLETYYRERIVLPHILRDVLGGMTEIAYFQDEIHTMRQYAETLLILGEEWQDKASTGLARFHLGLDALHKQDFGRAKMELEAGLILFRQVGNKRFTALSLLMLGNLAYFQKDYEQAFPTYAEGLVPSRESRDSRVEAMLLQSMGCVREEQSKYQDARAWYHQALQINRELDDKLGIATVLEYLGGLASLELSDHQRAARLMGAAEALRESIFAPVQPLEQPHHDAMMARLCANLDENAFTAAWAEGRVMTLEQAIDEALSE